MADYSRRHYEFSRTRTDGLPLERTGPAIEPMWKSVLAGAGLLVFMVVVIVGSLL